MLRPVRVSRLLLQRASTNDAERRPRKLSGNEVVDIRLLNIYNYYYD